MPRSKTTQRALASEQLLGVVCADRARLRQPDGGIEYFLRSNYTRVLVLLPVVASFIFTLLGALRLAYCVQTERALCARSVQRARCEVACPSQKYSQSLSGHSPLRTAPNEPRLHVCHPRTHLSSEVELHGIHADAEVVDGHFEQRLIDQVLACVSREGVHAGVHPVVCKGTQANGKTRKRSISAGAARACSIRASTRASRSLGAVIISSMLQRQLAPC